MKKIRKDKRKEKGFTLIELLAVIIILGVLMMIAIPSVTKYINDSRKKAYVTTISNYVQSAKVNMLAFGYDQKPKINEALLVPFSEIKMEKGNGVSPYGKFLNEQSYIIIVAKDGGAYSFYINAKDSSGHKIYNMPSSKIDSNIISTSSDVQEPMKISDIKNGSYIKVGLDNFKINDNNQETSNLILLSLENE